MLISIRILIVVLIRVIHILIQVMALTQQTMALIQRTMVLIPVTITLIREILIQLPLIRVVQVVQGEQLQMDTMLVVEQ